MWPRLGYFALGLLSGPVVRSILREVVKTGFIASQEAQRIVAEAKADAEDVMAEGRAKAEGTAGRHTRN